MTHLGACSPTPSRSSSRTPPAPSWRGGWRRAGLTPPRSRRYVGSPDPDCERKAAAITALYLQPPAHGAVFCVDEKPAIQALDRRDPVLPLSPGRAERHGFEYV